MKQTIEVDFHALGSAGGKANSQAQQAARVRNLELARTKRWKKREAKADIQTEGWVSVIQPSN